MRVLGISPLDKDASASLVEDGEILFAAGEERFSRVKQHAGFPRHAIEAAFAATGYGPEDIDVVAYAFLDADAEARLIHEAMAAEREFAKGFAPPDLGAALAAAHARVPDRRQAVHGLRTPDQRMRKGAFKEWCYRQAAENPALARMIAQRSSQRWADRAVADHRRWQQELHAELSRLGLASKLRRFEHHLSHAANAYLASGFEKALIVTLDGYGSGLAGSVSLGDGGSIKRLHNLRFPHSLGSFYESVTASLGFHPDRHAGKIVGLAAYGDPAVLTDVLLSHFRRNPGDFSILHNLDRFFSRHLASGFPMIDVAAAYQHALEIVAAELVRHWIGETGCDAVVLSGGVTANVKMNQRIHEVPGVERTFVYPNMGDGGCGTGLGLFLSLDGRLREPMHDAYLGPEAGDDEIRAELDREGLAYGRPDDLAGEVARRIHGGEVIGRYAGRMEYGPRALGNRSILYHAREPEVNQWLNQRLGRTEFMPFAPVTLYEQAERCYLNLAGAEHAAQFMTITFDCTPWMIENCPAAVHVDGTARPQLVRREVNPGYYDILKAYEGLSGVPCLINTSFNMHEEPIVCTPKDALRAFLLGHLDGLAIGSYFVPAPKRDERKSGKAGAERRPAAQPA